MTVDKKRTDKLTQRHRINWLAGLIMLVVIPPVATGAGASSVKKAVTNHGFQQILKRDKPINCEDLLAILDIAIIDWMELNGTYFIMIARRGTGEKDPNLIRARFDYVEDYLKRKRVQYVFAEGSPVEGYGRMEIYVGGRLRMSIPVEKGSNRLCWGNTGA
jgi:hypothetical protein